MKPLRVVSPWSTTEGVRWAALVVAGGVIAALGSWMAARRADFDDQLWPTTITAVGLIVLAYGNITWLVRGRRTMLDRRRSAIADLAARVPGAVLPPAEIVVAGRGRTSFHRPDCAFAAGRSWPTSSRKAAEAKGRTPCRVCRP
jgi:hypothetical protein